ncbi:fruiting body developmental protein S-like protein [Trichormus variabilis ATCC 29413]|uniref:Fruiting body developmental protein S-like protein n=2 Tax=Anabaena variabilis TaxID=264691 RepID=Q3M7D6_TRIV2|nr:MULTISPECIES: type I-MYXAN CRISPR-associated protein Cas5/Cmx5/DevS [Nostocaceae]ABA23100.1 fruiting body developmental protein S-like protein [Trichormus variabilis ATCC 29413]MBC1214084.1 type I-MYXAN CRISPR-associated protein Cas5/Cmx5/DevS [Trichormus variabilis ARAD]MBC1257308.1 type I-MYXAN CRISPR-associated protein Cas5/Cmx5/DevS [Trichormus variabilis V5]MBC1270205.1 type I-MYXAN CRISPR-associated protein Cas5/Cmx5/DevS [Trichormus variabilis FSR]MBC1303345.1 type I-MYXAN CRISPR-ass
MTTIALKVEVPIACFRQSRAREYGETYPVPPPSTVYGMLLSLVGEVDRYKHCGVKLAIALLSEPEKSTVIRTFHRFKTKNIHDSKNNKPDYQELLTNIEFIVWVDAGVDKAKPNLVERLAEALTNPASINRFGGLCLGESRDLVNDVTLLPKNYYAESMRWLIRDEYGLLTLPYWVDHVGSRGTRWLRYEIQKCPVFQPPELSWTSVQSN